HHHGELRLEEGLDGVVAPVGRRGRGGGEREREHDQGGAPAPTEAPPGEEADEAEHEGRGEERECQEQHERLGPVQPAGVVLLLVVAKTRHRSSERERTIPARAPVGKDGYSGANVAGSPSAPAGGGDGTVPTGHGDDAVPGGPEVLPPV